jgi:small subunit ribosomal protein S6
MIYELAYVLRTDATEEAQAQLAEVIKTTITEVKGEILLEDKWGVKTFAQATQNGTTKGNFFYIMFKSETECNVEMARRFRISEDVLKFMTIVLGKEADQEAIVAGYKNPDAATSEASMDSEKERKMFSKRKSCYFSAKKTSPDWKDPSSYSWLVNEFGKISPSRVTGLRPKYQRMATTAIKRGRCLGLISYMSNHVAR